jgi:hypothetical protein
MALVLPDTVVCQHVDMSTRKGKRVKFQELVIRGNNGRSRKVSEETSRVLLEASRHRALSELMNANELKASVRDAVLNEIQELWGERLILILPIEVNK